MQGKKFFYKKKHLSWFKEKDIAQTFIYAIESLGLSFIRN